MMHQWKNVEKEKKMYIPKNSNVLLFYHLIHMIDEKV